MNTPSKYTIVDEPIDTWALFLDVVWSFIKSGAKAGGMAGAAFAVASILYLRGMGGQASHDVVGPGGVPAAAFGGYLVGLVVGAAFGAFTGFFAAMLARHCFIPLTDRNQARCIQSIRILSLLCAEAAVIAWWAWPMIEVVVHEYRSPFS